MDELDLTAATARERTLHALLTRARGEERTSLPARRLVEQALWEWERGHRTRTLLFATPDDADARLAAIRARLLHDLAALTPEAPPLPALLSLGDATPIGWTAALETALRRAPGSGQTTRRAPTLRARSAVDDWDDAGRLLPLDDRALTRSLHAVRFCDGAGELRVARVVAWDRPRGWHDEHGPALGLRTDRGSDWSPLLASTWRAVAALVAGLHATPALGLQPAAERYAVQLLRSALGRVASRHGSASEALAWVIAALREMVPPSVRERGAGVLAEPLPELPGAGLLLRTLDALGGDGGGAPELPATVGTWLEVVDSDGGEPAGGPLAGRLLEPPVAEGSRSWAVRPGVEPRRPHAELKAWLRVGDRDRRFPWTRLRTPRRARLFD